MENSVKSASMTFINTDPYYGKSGNSTDSSTWTGPTLNTVTTSSEMDILKLKLAYAEKEIELIKLQIEYAKLMETIKNIPVYPTWPIWPMWPGFDPIDPYKITCLRTSVDNTGQPSMSVEVSTSGPKDPGPMPLRECIGR